MRSLLAPVFAALAASALLCATAGAEEPAKNQLTFRFDHDPFFLNAPSLTLQHPLAGTDGIDAMVTNFLDYRSIELDVGYTRALGGWTLSPAFGVTFGPASWGFSPDTHNYIGRDVVPQFGAYYSSARWEAEAYHGVWIPTQESRLTATWYTETQWWVAAKRDGFGLGPHVETYGTKEGRRAMRLTHLWSGVHFLADLPKGASCQLFLGYDSVSLASYLGAKKDSGAVYRFTFIYPL